MAREIVHEIGEFLFSVGMPRAQAGHRRSLRPRSSVVSSDHDRRVSSQKCKSNCEVEFQALDA